jgi:hypothetical protein
MRGRIAGTVGMAAAALAFSAAPAQADHHEVRIAEVSAGGLVTFTTAEYVQLQMTSSGQNLFQGTGSTVTLYDADGGQELSTPVNANVPNGQRGRRVLIGASDLPGGTAPDFTWIPGNYLSPNGGAACFTSGVFGPIDCVSWGDYDGDPPPPSPTGGNAPAFPDGLGLARRTPPCGPGLIDTNDPDDLEISGLNPANNASPAATGDPCPNTTITKKPRKRTTKRRAVFEFKSSINPATFRCKLDSAPFRDCDTPFRKRVKRGKHTFRVRATAGGATDPTPASYRWKVVRR